MTQQITMGRATVSMTGVVPTTDETVTLPPSNLLSLKMWNDHPPRHLCRSRENSHELLSNYQRILSKTPFATP